MRISVREFDRYGGREESWKWNVAILVGWDSVGKDRELAPLNLNKSLAIVPINLDDLSD